MKKYIFLLLVTALSFAQASNQMVSFTQAQSLGFALKSGQSHVTSTQCMTKTEALAKYNLDANAMSSYTSNQLVPKSTWVASIVNYSYQLYQGNCTGYSQLITVYSSSSLITVGMVFYTDAELTNVLNGPSYGYNFYYTTSNSVFVIDRSGVLNSNTAC